MTTPPAQAAGYPTWEIKEANLSLQDLPGGSGLYGNLNVGSLTVAGSIPFGPSNAIRSWLVPSADATGATDYANMQGLLNLGAALYLKPGATYSVSKTVEIPVNGGVIIGDGGLDFVGDTAAAVIQPGSAFGASAALVATKGWLEGTNTSSALSSRVEGVFFYNTATAHALVLQSGRSAVVRCIFNTIGGDAIRFDIKDVTGSVQISNTAAECRVERCIFRTITGNSVHGTDTTSTGVFTDGYIEHCNFAAQSSDCISLGTIAGWLIEGCHLYGLQQNGIVGNQAFDTRIIGNYIEPWGLTSTVGTYNAIKCAFTKTNAGTIISANTIRAGGAGASNTINGINFQTATGNVGKAVISGNQINAPSGPATNGIIISNQTTGTTTADVRGNIIDGVWVTPINQTPNSGTIAIVGSPAAAANTKPANPASTVSTTLVMMGCAVAYTPASSGKVAVTVTGQATTATAAVSLTLGGRYGTGGAPANGAAVTGTRFGAAADYAVTPPGIGVGVPFCLTDVLALTPGTAYWLDLALSTSAAADAASLSNLSVTISETA